MKMMFSKKRLLTAVSLAGLSLTAIASQSVDLDGIDAATDESMVAVDQRTADMINEFCIDCHGARKQKSGRRFDQLFIERDGQYWLDTRDTVRMELLTEVMDIMNLDMPPPDEGVGQPSPALKAHSIDWITNTLLWAKDQQTPVMTVLRRLNQQEYLNSLGDLLGNNYSDHGLTDSFPSDENLHGFRNIGAALNVSERCLTAISMPLIR